MLVDVIIPTHRTRAEVAPLVCDVEGLSYPNRVHATCAAGSASHNRNLGLEWARTPVVIMIDDDMRGFYTGWVDDLVAPLLRDTSIVMVSARLVTPEGKVAQMVGHEYSLRPEVVEVQARELPTAAVAFRASSLRFDEGFIGSGFEDNWFCKQLGRKFPGGMFMVSNRCKLVHLNEQKNQHGSFWDHNKAHYNKLCSTL